MSSLIQVFEHTKLTIHNNSNGAKLSKKQLDSLLAFNDNNNNKYFTGIREGIKFKEYVGVIQVGGTTIEILPKADKIDNGDYTKWRNVLLRMLGVCKKISLETISDANLKKRNHSLLEMYFDRFIEEVEKLLNKGLIKKYRTKDSNVFALKGQLLFAQNIQKNFIHQERFYTKHQTYDYEHLINQTLLKALQILSGLVSNTFLIDRINRIKLNFPEIKEIEIDAKKLNSIVLSRKSQDYSEALQIAKMIILNYSPDIKGGSENMIAILFNMNTLWEEYIFRMLLKTEQVKYIIRKQRPLKFWEDKTIRPDIVIFDSETKKALYIIDTKWKVIDYLEPSDADLKQMYVYNQYWDVEKSLLLYPQIEPFNENFGKYHKGINPENYCKLGFVNVLKDGVLDMNIGQNILNKLV